jgi:glyoxylase-like metal-dependent hydrolase (beta-lactamase superfamily II)
VKKLIRAAVVLVVLVVLLLVGGFASAFVGNTETKHGEALSDGRVITVVDGFVTCFLVRSSASARRWLLIDACNDPEATVIKGALAAAGSSPADVGLILLTHGHFDHANGAAAFPDAEVRAMPADIPLLTGEVGMDSPMGSLVPASDSGVRVKRPLEDREKITFDGTTVEVLALPGHTPGSAVFFAHGVLFMGDSAGMTADGMKGTPWVFSADTAQNGAELVGLYNRFSRREADVKHMTFGHTGSTRGIAALKAFTP